MRENGKLDFSPYEKPIYISHASRKQQSLTEIFHIHDDKQNIHRLNFPWLHEDIISSDDEGEAEDAEALEGRKDTQIFKQDLYKYISSSKGLHLASDDNILYKMRSQQEICCTYKGDKSNDAYQKLIKETMELTSRPLEYQKRNKLTMGPRLAIAEPQCS